MRWILAGLLVVSVAAGGCEDKAKLGAGGKPRLTTDEELDKLEQGLLKRIERNKGLSCTRPVLRGEAAAGKAGPDLIAVVEGAEDTQACLDGLEKHSELLFEAMDLPDGQTLEGWPANIPGMRPQLEHGAHPGTCL